MQKKQLSPKDPIISQLLSNAINIQYSSNTTQQYSQITLIQTQSIWLDLIKKIKQVCTKIKTLYYNSGDYTVLQKVAEIESLESLKVTNIAKYLDIGISVITKMSNLKYLYLASSEINDENISNISKNLHQLQKLTIGITRIITYKSIQSLSSLPLLVHLQFSQMKPMQPSIMKMVFSTLKNLKTLELTKCWFSQKDLIQISSLIKLQSFILNKTTISRDTFLISVNKLPINLKNIQLFTLRLNSDDIDALIQRCTNLVSLKLQNCKVTDNEVLLISNKIKNLEQITFVNDQITNQSIRVLSQNNRNLKRLVIDQCQQITTDCFVYISQMQQLKSFEFSRTIFEFTPMTISQRFIIYLTKLLKIQYLKLFKTDISKNVLKKVFVNLKNLKRLEVGCNKNSKEIKEQRNQRIQNLRIV